ncbi:hypothetical protein NDU88_001275 [Pleurodeles waltl]|uniref:Uncharacterized protein n=1 Tax=Pleurodeles waltl TaxID=8319 RepID=A0AAV7SZW1_PLEWA|nr:hypothetical protein NDU88_001275 [Pleurodeles waltl]
MCQTDHNTILCCAAGRCSASRSNCGGSRGSPRPGRGGSRDPGQGSRRPRRAFSPSGDPELGCGYRYARRV